MNIDDLRSELASSPYYSRYGIKLSMDHNEVLVLELPATKKVIGNPAIKAIHGGMVAMALELTAKLHANLNMGINLTPLNQTTSYFRPTIQSSLFTSATLVKLGRRFVVIEATAWQQTKEKPVAKAVFTLQS